MQGFITQRNLALSGVSNPASIIRLVVLPEPEGPSRVKIPHECPDSGFNDQLVAIVALLDILKLT